jgi:hypothetical protein
MPEKAWRLHAERMNSPRTMTLKSWTPLPPLAATGDYPQAIAVANKALANSGGKKDFAQQVEAHLALYQKHQRFVDSALGDQ